MLSVASGIGGGRAQIDLVHKKIIVLLSLSAKIVTDDTHAIHSLLLCPHARKFRTC